MLYEDEVKDIERLWKKLQDYRIRNAIKKTYYDAKRIVKDLGVSIPPSMRHIQESCGWPKIAVDSLNERIQFEGWESEGLNEIFDANGLDDIGGLVHLDALLYGIGFVVVGKGDQEDGEPKALVTVESPNSIAADYSLRKRRITTAIKVVHLENNRIYGNYFTSDEVIPFMIISRGIFPIEEEPRYEHKHGRVPVVQFLNRPDTDAWAGHSEITEPITSITNSMIRTMLGMEVAREFHAAPQRYILGAEADMFEDVNTGERKDALQTYMDRMLILPGGGSDGDVLPQVGQFTTNSPSAFIEPMRFYSQLFSAEACIPENYLGFNTVNPTSADAIRASESRLIKRAEQRISSFRRGWIEVAYLVNLLLDEPIEDFDPTPIFRDPSTPTRSAAADEVTKLVSMGILSADSDIVLRRLGLNRKEREIARMDANSRNATMLAKALAAGAEEVA